LQRRAESTCISSVVKDGLWKHETLFYLNRSQY
jgi:hypothetical protein